MEKLIKETFIEKVFDYEKAKELDVPVVKSKGAKPIIIDFYAEWCGPCKAVAPILEELNKEIEGIDIYKINTEEQHELAQVFGITSIPSLLFIPLQGQPQMVNGALSKDNFKEIIKDLFKIG